MDLDQTTDDLIDELINGTNSEIHEILFFFTPKTIEEQKILMSKLEKHLDNHQCVMLLHRFTYGAFNAKELSKYTDEEIKNEKNSWRALHFGASFINCKNYEQAAKCYEKAASLGNQHGTIYIAILIGNKQIKNPGIKTLRQISYECLEKEQLYINYFNLASCLFVEGSYSRALTYAEKYYYLTKHDKVTAYDLVRKIRGQWNAGSQSYEQIDFNGILLDKLDKISNKQNELSYRLRKMEENFYAPGNVGEKLAKLNFMESAKGLDD